MPTIKIKDYTKEPYPCMSPSHNPPSHQVFTGGEYEHTCPACSHVTKFFVPVVTY